MLYKNFAKTFKKLMIENDIGTKEISIKLNESQQNITGKINRKTIRLMDVERVLDVLGYKLEIVKKD